MVIKGFGNRRIVGFGNSSKTIYIYEALAIAWPMAISSSGKNRNRKVKKVLAGYKPDSEGIALHQMNSRPPKSTNQTNF